PSSAGTTTMPRHAAGPITSSWTSTPAHRPTLRPLPHWRPDMPHPFRIETAVEIEATPEEVWEALTVGEQLDGWWIGAPNEVEPRLGGKGRQSFRGEGSPPTITPRAPP